MNCHGRGEGTGNYLKSVVLVLKLVVRPEKQRINTYHTTQKQGSINNDKPSLLCNRVKKKGRKKKTARISSRVIVGRSDRLSRSIYDISGFDECSMQDLQDFVGKKANKLQMLYGKD